MVFAFSFVRHAMALAGPEAVYEDYLYVHCLKETFKTVERDIIDHGSAHDPIPDETFL